MNYDEMTLEEILDQESIKKYGEIEGNKRNNLIKSMWACRNKLKVESCGKFIKCDKCKIKKEYYSKYEF